MPLLPVLVERTGVAVKASGLRSFHTALRVTNAASFLFNSSSSFFLLLPIYLQQLGNSPAQIGLVAGLLRAESKFRRLKGHRGMPTLLKALEVLVRGQPPGIGRDVA